MMKTIIFAVIISCISLSSFADNGAPDRDRPQRGAMNPDKMLSHMSEELDLNDQQSSQIKAIVEKHQSEINASRQQLASIREQTHAQVSAVLDDQQRQKFEALNKQAKDKRKGKKPSQNKLETMRTQLTLTDAQTASIDTVLSSSRKQLQAIHMKNRELRRQMNSEIKTVLNSQQQVKFESMQQQRKDKYKERKGNKHKTPE